MIHSALISILNPATADSFASHFAGALIAEIWEGVLLAGAVGLCLLLLPNTTARLRFMVWMVVFAVLAALPVLNVLFAGHGAVARSLPAGPLLQLDPRWSYAFAALWLAAAIGRCAHLAVQAFRLRLLWRSALPVSTGLLPELPLGRVELCLSTEIDRPSVIGFLSPRILIPAWLFDQLTPGEVEQIVLHELEHLRRRDDWINLLQKIGLVLFPLNPALFWIDRRLAAERELACDDGVLGRTHAPRAYATCLTTLAERRLEHRRSNRLTVLALGALGAVRHSQFSRRIESILGFGWRSKLDPAPARVLASVLIAGVLFSAVTLARAPKLVSFDAASEARPLAAQMAPSEAVRTDRMPPARFENAVFHSPQPAAGNSPAPNTMRRRLKTKPRYASPAVKLDAVSSESAQRPTRRMMVLTSWQQNPPQPVLVTLPDGRTFLATFAADPNQAGWLLIQL